MPIRPRLLIAAVVVLAACRDTTAVNRRFAVLDDVGQSDWIAISVGQDHSCGLRAGGVAYCWGSNQSGQLGTQLHDTLCGPTKGLYPCVLAPLPVETTLRWRTISAGGAHTCGITVGGDAYCWGANNAGQLGDFSQGGGSALVAVASALGWQQISAGFDHTCAVRADAALLCWGSNDRGQAGVGGVQTSVGISRVQMPTPVASVSAGKQRTCARAPTGAVYCWGNVWTDRENGSELARTQPTPQLVPSSPAMTGVSVGSFTTCGMDATGFAYCWEANPRGSIGDATTAGSTSPRRIASNLEFVQLAAGLVQTCGIVAGGAGYCWGDDTFGQLGVRPSVLSERCDQQSAPCSTVPIAIYGRQQFTMISTSFGSHTCGVTTHGNLYCWGLGVSGQRGDGTSAGAVSVPSTVAER